MKGPKSPHKAVSFSCLPKLPGAVLLVCQVEEGTAASGVWHADATMGSCRRGRRRGVDLDPLGWEPLAETLAGIWTHGNNIGQSGRIIRLNFLLICLCAWVLGSLAVSGTDATGWGRRSVQYRGASDGRLVRMANMASVEGGMETDRAGPWRYASPRGTRCARGPGLQCHNGRAQRILRDMSVYGVGLSSAPVAPGDEDSPR